MLLIDHNDIDYNVEVEDYNGYRKELILKNDLRNKILLSVIEILAELKLKTLVLFQSIEHGRSIENIRDSESFPSLYSYVDDSDDKSISDVDLYYRPNIVGNKYPLNNWLSPFYYKLR